MKAIYSILLCLFANAAFAQSYASFQYSINFPLSNTADFISKPSFRGVTLDYRYEVTPRVLVGFSTGWYTFYDEPGLATYTLPDETLVVTGTQFRYLNSVPVLFVADYYISEGEFKPFVGLGIGTTYNRIDVDMGMYTVRVDPWQFALVPEAGVAYQIREGTSALFSVRYNLNFEAGDLETQSYLGLNFGIVASLSR